MNTITRYRLKTPGEIDAMRQAGIAVATALRTMRDAIVAGETTTLFLDEIAGEVLKQFNAKPALRGYKPSFSNVPYLHNTCISLNHEVIHGVPSASRIIREGDLISLDMTGSVDGWCADSTITVPVGVTSEKARRLSQITREAMYKGIEQARIGRTIGDIGYAIQRHVERNGMSVVRDMVGHGIGEAPHEPGLDVPNFGRPRRGIPLQVGMTFAIEPMVTLGKGDVEHASFDPWTIVSKDGSLAAHWEHTIAVTREGPVILTSPIKEERDTRAGVSIEEDTNVSGTH
ncbi:MAG: type I methionyl aminopeptidase [Capsulimonadales bacterium]|nr:type I methionyl aminopeptidase [Capsulimonadales bacterium]